jgi:hypothetical protein
MTAQPSKHPDRLTAIASGFVAALALAVSTYNVILQRQQLRAQVWPYLNLWHTTGTNSGFRISVENNGTGPARVQWTRLIVDGKEYPSEEWVKAFPTLAGHPFKDGSVNQIRGRVITPGTEINAFQSFDDKLNFDTFERIEFDVCYCSVLDECWTITRSRQPSAVSRCPAQ